MDGRMDGEGELKIEGKEMRDGGWGREREGGRDGWRETGEEERE